MKTSPDRSNDAANLKRAEQEVNGGINKMSHDDLVFSLYPKIKGPLTMIRRHLKTTGE